MQNRMYVTDAYVGGQEYTPEAARDTLVQTRASFEISNGKEPSKTRNNAIEELRALAGICNTGEFDAATVNLPLHQRKINGDATDQAILRFSEGLGSVSALRSAWKKGFEIAFNSKNKYMLRIVEPVDAESLRGTLADEEQKEYGREDLSVQLIPRVQADGDGMFS